MIKIIFILILSGIFIGISADPVTLPQKEGHVFSNLKDEYKLVSYYLSRNQKKYYKKLDEESKWKYLSAFWGAQDQNSETEDNEFLLEVIARIEYSNKHFSHFTKGWETDMGRIYIKHGEPFEILELNTGLYAKSTPKDYQIWKYRISWFQTYLFIDLQQHGNYRLIFSDGFEEEGSYEYWERYLGYIFDVRLLQ
jgi:GWxTD domain-containing protein